MASASAKKIRPKYLSLPALLFEIRLPVPGWVSILHRISGAWLFFPFAAWLLYLLDKSLQSEQGFQYVKTQYLALPVVKLGLLVFIWSYLPSLLRRHPLPAAGYRQGRRPEDRAPHAAGS